MKQYLADHKEIFKGRDDKFVCLMDLALMAMSKLKKEGKLQDQEESDEINACSIVVPVRDRRRRPRSGWSTLKMRRTTIRQRSSRLVARLPVWAVRSVIRCQDVPMYIRQCV